MNRLNADRLKELAEKWLNGTILPEERELLNEWYNHEQGEPVEWNLEDAGEQQLEERLFTTISKEIHLKKQPSVLRRRITLLASAAVVIFCSVGVFLSLNKPEKGRKIVYKPYKGEVLPGSNKAVLTLANGLKIALNDVSEGEVAYQEGIKITKATEGQIVYSKTTPSGNIPSAEGIEREAFNTIEVPKGGQYSLILPDGTRVWLNSASSLRYPALFAGKERNVELTGEAYFEVAKDPARPFKVSAGGTMVQVLGTHFNISAYPDDEYVATTLLEGSVKMSHLLKGALSDNASEIKLKPGQQAIALHTGGQINVRAVKNADDAIAWKSGYFKFNNEDIRSIMKRVSRWYNVNVVYQGDMNDKIYGGTFSRSKSIADLLYNLQLTGTIHFKIEDAYISESNGYKRSERRIVVMP
ncbi:DUF4974 domain-containing protein [Pedobacter sp. BS3]|uniref:FecR family protein n=1 Tax=Pedobacter sp. BS3 TaxID=2567937 RepID=UPI0011EFA72B|nr:FecR family protein [Pedobacter sp. BS3]TZF81349.1 DUF4974 domain-containing protein [Pedobacter sp. BS3]